MAKYNYDKKVLKGLSVGPFLNEVKVREEEIAEAVPYDIKATFNANILADKLHPGVVIGRIKKIIEHSKDVKTFVIVPEESEGCTSLPYFRAGQYISIGMKIGESYISRPYTICSNPALAMGEENNEYRITIKRKKNDGFVSDFLLDNAFPRMQLAFSYPLGNFYYQELRDKKNVIALAGGSGITPFLSMASAIATGIEDFNLTILYGSVSKKDIILKDELEEVAKASNGKVKVIHILSDDDKEFNVANKEEKEIADESLADDVLIFEKDGSEISIDSQGNVTEKQATIADLVEGKVDTAVYEHGFITIDLIKKYAFDGEYSIFVCGPKAMYRFLREELKKLDIPKRLIRFEVEGEYGNPEQCSSYPKDKTEEEYKLIVRKKGQIIETKCKRTESIMVALERAATILTTDCRSGECGWCHSRLISGDIFIPEGKDKRKMGDKKFGWIHPCITYPLSDIEIEVFPMA